MEKLKEIEDEITKKKIELKRLELDSINMELSKKKAEVNEKRIKYQQEARIEHDKAIINSMDEPEFERYFAAREEREKKEREMEKHFLVHDY